MLSLLIMIIGCLVSLIGWFVFHSEALLIAGTVIYVIEAFVERKQLNFNAKVLEVVIFGIGCIIGMISKVPFYVGGMIAINCYSALISLISIFWFLSFFRKLFVIRKGT